MNQSIFCFCFTFLLLGKLNYKKINIFLPLFIIMCQIIFGLDC